MLRWMPQPLMDSAHPWVIDERALLVHHEVIVALELFVANRAGLAPEGCDKIARLGGKTGEVVRPDGDKKRRPVAFDLCGRAGARDVAGWAQKRLDERLAVAGGRCTRTPRARLAEVVSPADRIAGLDHVGWQPAFCQDVATKRRQCRQMGARRVAAQMDTVRIAAVACDVAV